MNGLAVAAALCTTGEEGEMAGSKAAECPGAIRNISQGQVLRVQFRGVMNLIYPKSAVCKGIDVAFHLQVGVSTYQNTVTEVPK